MSLVVVLDCEMGNHHSIDKVLRSELTKQQKLMITSDPKVVAKADRLIIPGVGTIGYGMEMIHHYGLYDVVLDKVAKVPVMGICIGMHLLMTFSDESGGVQALGRVAGSVKHLHHCIKDDPSSYKVPHMGWNTVTYPEEYGDERDGCSHNLWSGIQQDSYFYFVHSYVVQPDNQQVIDAKTDYGIDFPVAIWDSNCFAVQFHPEKSQEVGCRLLHNFLRWNI